MSLEAHQDDPTMAGRGRVPGFVEDPERMGAALAHEAALADETAVVEPADVEDGTTDPAPAIGRAAAAHVSGPGEPVIDGEVRTDGDPVTYGPAIAGDETGATAVDEDEDYDKRDAAVEARAENDLDRPGADEAAVAGGGAAAAVAGGGAAAAVAAARERAGETGEVITHRSREYRRGRTVVVAAAVLGAAAVACVVYAFTADSPNQVITRLPATERPEAPPIKDGETDSNTNEGDGEQKGGPTEIPTLADLPETYDGTSTWPWGDAASEVGPAKADEHLQDQIASARKHGAVVRTFEVKDEHGHVVRWGVLSISYPAVDGSTQTATSTEDVVDVLDYYGNLED